MEEDSVWVGTYEPDRIVRIVAGEKGLVVDRSVAVEAEIRKLVADGDQLWTLRRSGTELGQRESLTGSVIRQYSLEPRARHLLVCPTAVFVSGLDQRIRRIDRFSGEISSIGDGSLVEGGTCDENEVVVVDFLAFDSQALRRLSSSEVIVTGENLGPNLSVGSQVWIGKYPTRAVVGKVDLDLKSVGATTKTPGPPGGFVHFLLPGPGGAWAWVDAGGENLGWLVLLDTGENQPPLEIPIKAEVVGASNESLWSAIATPAGSTVSRYRPNEPEVPETLDLEGLVVSLSRPAQS